MRRNEENFDYILKRYEAARAKGGSIFLDAADLLDIYDYYAENFRNEEAKDVLMHAVKLYPEDEDVIIAHAYYHKNIGDWKTAENIIEKLPKDSIYRKLFYAEEALAMLELDKNRRLINEIVHSGHELTYDNALDIAEMYYEAGYYHLAEPWLQKCNTPQYAEFSRAACELADCLFRKGELDAAIAVMNNCLDEDPYDAEAWVQLAKIQYTAHKDEEALESCDYAIAANKDYAEAYAVRFDTLLRLDKLDEMWESLKSPMQQQFCSADNMLTLAYEFESKGEVEKASKVYHIAARLYSDNPEARDQIHRHLAHEAALQGRLEDARDLIFRHADRENYVKRFASWATLLFITRNEEKAVETLRYAITIPGIRTKDFSEIILLLYNTDYYEEVPDIWEAIFKHTKEEGLEMEHPATVAFAAYRLKNNDFPTFLKFAMQKDLFTCIHLLGEKINFQDPETAMREAHKLVQRWTEKH